MGNAAASMRGCDRDFALFADGPAGDAALLLPAAKTAIEGGIGAAGAEARSSALGLPKATRCTGQSGSASFVCRPCMYQLWKRLHVALICQLPSKRQRSPAGEFKKDSRLFVPIAREAHSRDGQSH